MLNPIRSVARFVAWLQLAIPAICHIAPHFSAYQVENDLDFEHQVIEDQERTLHDYLTHELGLNLFSDIVDAHTIRMTYGVTEQGEYLDMNLAKSLPLQIQKLIQCCDRHCKSRPGENGWAG